MSDYEPTDEVLERATIALHDADCPDRKCEPHTMGAYRRQARVVLAAVGPVIAAGALREAGDAMDTAQTRVGVTPEERLIRRDPALWLNERADQIEERA